MVAEIDERLELQVRNQTYKYKKSCERHYGRVD